MAGNISTTEKTVTVAIIPNGEDRIVDRGGSGQLDILKETGYFLKVTVS